MAKADQKDPNVLVEMGGSLSGGRFPVYESIKEENGAVVVS